MIEAVFESLELKQALLAEVEAVTPNGTVFASNTSSLPIGEIAAHAARPEAVLGMHYFSPVEKMPLLEVIVTEDTADWATVTAVQFGKRQGKTVIVVKDGPGFYTTRILVPYINEAFHLLADGASVEDIDTAMTTWGFPVGPVLLSDEVGIDVGAHISKVMLDAFGERMAGPEMAANLVGDDRMGRKNGRGFYRYDDKGKRGGVDETVYPALGIGPRRVIPEAEIQQRIALAMVNEAARCLEEGVLQSASTATSAPSWASDSRRFGAVPSGGSTRSEPQRSSRRSRRSRSGTECASNRLRFSGPTPSRGRGSASPRTARTLGRNRWRATVRRD